MQEWSEYMKPNKEILQVRAHVRAQSNRVQNNVCN